MTPFLSDDVAAERAAAKSFGAPILIAKGEVRGVSSATDSITTMHQVNVTTFALDAITNLLILSRCDAFVGTFSSNFGRLAYELAFANSKAAIIPGVSLDVFWHAFP